MNVKRFGIPRDDAPVIGTCMDCKRQVEVKMGLADDHGVIVDELYYNCPGVSTVVG